MRIRISIVLMLFISGALVCGCKAESRPEASKHKGTLLPKQLVAQSEKAPASEPIPDTAQVSGKPKILFEQTEYDFGRLDQGVKIEHAFIFKNTGDAPLIVDKVRSS